MTPQELKASILQLAIQGKLVPQLPEEGTGEELFQQIQAEKQRLVKAGKIKKEKSLPGIEEDEVPFDIPETWTWIRLGDCSGYAQAKEKIASSDITGDMWSLDLEDIQKETGAVITQTKASERKITGDKVRFYKGQVLYSKLRPYLKKILVAPADGICTPELVPFDAYLVDANYLVCVLRSPHVDFVVNSVTYGVKMPRVGTDTMINLLIPLPPLAEQKRIVAKIDELLPLIDRYEQAWSRLEEFNKRFPVDMQKSILQMAIQGKLVPQLPEEGTVSVLKKELQKKKAEWVASGRILKKADSKPFLDSDDLFDIPDSWEWMQLSDVSIIQEGAGIRKWQYRDAGTQILCVTNILEGDIDLEKKKLYISTDEYLEKYRHLTLNKGDIVTSCSGGSWGKIAFFDCEDTMMLNTSTLRMRFFDDLADNNYLYYVCKSPFFKRQLELQLSGMQPNFGYAHYSRILLPLPPLAEQKRIVAKLEEILPLCERLK